MLIPGQQGRTRPSARLPQLSLRTLLAASVALPQVAMPTMAWAQLGTSSNVPPQNVFGPRNPPGTGPTVGTVQPAPTPATAPAPMDAPVAVPTAAPASPSTGPADPVKVLLDQASYWRSQYQTGRAVESLNRVLQLDGNNADALAMLAQIQAEGGNTQAAQAMLGRLRSAHPGDPRIPSVEQSIRVGPLDQSQLTEARTLSQQGKSADAVSRYQRVFKGDTPPEGLATEYYQTLGGTSGGFDQAREGLGRQVTSNPRDLRAQLAYAQLLTYREPTRPEGIQRLTILAQNPAIAEQANQSLRQALLWLPDDSSSVSQLNVYVQRNPNDAELKQKLEAARNPPQAPIDEAGHARVTAYEELKRGRLADAERDFQKALAMNANDADATAGLGMVRLRQGRTQEGRALLTHALELGPSETAGIEATLRGTTQTGRTGGRGGNAGNTGGRGYAGDGGAAMRALRGQYAQVVRLTEQGKYDEAESLLRRLAGPRPDWGNYLQLGDIQARAGKLGEAEANFRRSMEMNPRNSAAAIGLAGVLLRQNRDAEAEALYARIGNTGGVRAIGLARAEQLRNQARGITDPVAQAGLYRAAINADPSNPWLRLELARALIRQNREPEARAVMAGVGDGPDEQGIQAAFYFAAQTNDLPRANALAARLPPGKRTPDMLALQQRATVQGEIRQAMQSGSRAMVRTRLLGLAAQPDPSGVRGAEIARTFLALNDKPGVRDTIATALASNRAPTAQQRLTYSGALLGAGLDQDAEAVAASVDVARLPRDQRPLLDGLADNIAAAQSDKLNGQGRTADAYDELAPRLAANPANPSLNMALSRLYQANGDPSEAVAITQTLLDRNPENLDVRRAAVDAAIGAGNLGRASAIAAEGVQNYPNDPRSFVISAQVAKAQGNNGRALRDLRTARDLRLQQIGSTQAAAPRDVAPPRNTRPFSLPDVRSTRDRLSEAETPLPGQATFRPVVSRSAVERMASTADYRAAQLAQAGQDAPHGAPVRMAQPVPNAPYKAELAQAYLGTGPQGFAPAPGAPTPLNEPPDLGVRASSPTGTPPASLNTAATAPYQNPFRRGPRADDFQPVTPGIVGDGIALQPPDPLAQSIERDIATLQDEVAPQVQVGLGFRGRSGEGGLSRLNEVTAPLEASFSPGGIGKLRVQVTPTYLDGETPSNNSDGTLLRFGTNPLLGGAGQALARAGNQSDFGTGLNVAYSYLFATVDVGATPVGFREGNVVGGIELAPQLGQDFRLRVIGERRAVTDSLLSYAGAKDPVTGLNWGGVVRNRGYAQLEWAPGRWFFYGGAGGGVVTGHHVQDNGFLEAQVGGSYGVYRDGPQELRVGLSLSYFNYEKNENFFTFGNGGYFSPQDYFAAQIPVTWRDQPTERLSYKVGGSIGIQTFQQKGSLVFPNDPGLQALANQLALTNANTLTSYGNQHDVSVAGGASGEIEYKVTDALRVGARAAFQRAGDFTEGTGLVYARYIFNGAR